MFFLVIIAGLIWYQGHSTTATSSELWFVLSMFIALAYVGGFLDSRIFARLDKKNANLLADVEARYESQNETTSTPTV